MLLRRWSRRVSGGKRAQLTNVAEAVGIVRSAKHLLRKVSAASPLKLQQNNVAVALEIVRPARVAFCRLRKLRSTLTPFKHILARTLVAAARGTSNFRWIFNKEGFVSNLKT